MVEEIVILVAMYRVIRVIARHASTILDFRFGFRGAFIVAFAHEQGVHDFRSKVAAARGHARVRMRVADSAVGNLQAVEDMILATGPDGSAPALVDGNVFDHCLQLLAVPVTGVRIGHMRVPAKVESTLRIGSAIEHQPFDVGV